MTCALAGQGISAKRCCRILGVSASGYFSGNTARPRPESLRRRSLTGLINETHARSRDTYGYRRMTAELRLGLNTKVNHKLVARLMAEQGLQGLPRRKARRSGPKLRPSEGKLYCCVVQGAFAWKVVGWSIDTRQDAALVTNALGIAAASLRPGPSARKSRMQVLHLQWARSARPSTTP